MTPHHSAVARFLGFVLFSLNSTSFSAAPAVKEVKFLVHSTGSDAPITRSLVERGGAPVLATYEGSDTHAVALPESAREAFLRAMTQAGADPRELSDQIDTPRRTIRPGIDLPPPATATAGLFILQFVAPATRQWQTIVRNSGAVVVETLPERSLVLAATRQQMATLAPLPWVRYTGPYLPDYKFAPVGASRGLFVVQVADTPLSADAVSELERRVGGFVTRSSAANRLTAHIRTNLDTARRLLNDPFVLGVETYVAPQPSDERQALSLTGATSIFGGNYLNWLAGYGISPTALTNSGIVVDVADTGIDEGCRSDTSNRAHPDLKGRIIYHNGTTGTHLDPDYRDYLGHGTVVAGIAAGNPVAGINTAGQTTLGVGAKDSDAYGQFYYGMGVAPGLRVGNTVIMNGNQIGSVREWTTRAVTQRCNTPSIACPGTATGPLCSATVQNHSNNEYEPNGANAGYYTSTAQAFDMSVRSADHGSAIPLAVTVSAGNIGQVATDPTTTVLAPATAKNVITVGAVESFRELIPPACLSDTGQGSNPELRNAAGGYNVLAYGSRRGTVDNRLKPDVLAPATLALGPRAVGGDLYCARGGDPAQPWYEQYHGASGTSFAAPVAAGSIALLQYRYGALSPAMYKAMLIAGARSIKGGYDRYTGSTITSWPNAQQGFGVMTLDKLFTPSIPRVLVDQAKVLLQSQGEYYYVRVADPTQPMKIVLAWTDPPGAVQQPGGTNLRALRNDLDLTANTVDGYRFYGNYVSATTGYSATPGGCGRPSCPSPADTRNNVEVVHIDPARFASSANHRVTLRVFAANLMGSAVESFGGGVLNQDFALVVINGSLEP